MNLDLDAIQRRNREALTFATEQVGGSEYAPETVMEHFDQDVPALIDMLGRIAGGRRLAGQRAAELEQERNRVIAEKQDLKTVVAQQARDLLAGRHITDLADDLAERLYDAAHEHCEDGCYGGGRPWYGPVAARLVDPTGPLANIAVEQQIAREDTENADGRESLDNAAWLGLLRVHYRSVSAAKDDHEARRRLVDMGALVVEWLTDMDKRDQAATVTRPYPESPCETCEHPFRRHITSSPLRVLGCVVRDCECQTFRATGSNP